MKVGDIVEYVGQFDTYKGFYKIISLQEDEHKQIKVVSLSTGSTILAYKTSFVVVGNDYSTTHYTDTQRYNTYVTAPPTLNCNCDVISNHEQFKYQHSESCPRFVKYEGVG